MLKVWVEDSQAQSGIHQVTMVLCILEDLTPVIKKKYKMKWPNSLKSWLLLEQGGDLCQWHSMANWRVEDKTLCGKSEDGKSPSEQDWGKTSRVCLGFIYCLGVYTCVH